MLFATLILSCKKEPSLSEVSEKPNETINSYLLPLSKAKYVFKEAKSGKLDSFEINGFSTSFDQYDLTGTVGVTVRIAKDEFNIYSTGSTKKAKSDSSNYGTGLIKSYKTQNGIIFNIDNNNIFYPSKGFRGKTKDSIINILEYNSFKNIICFSIFEQMHIYFAKDVGLIRFEYLKLDEVWDLIKYQKL